MYIFQLVSFIPLSATWHSLLQVTIALLLICVQVLSPPTSMPSIMIPEEMKTSPPSMNVGNVQVVNNQEVTMVTEQENEASLTSSTLSGPLIQEVETEFGLIAPKLWCYKVRDKYNIIPGISCGSLRREDWRLYRERHCDGYFLDFRYISSPNHSIFLTPLNTMMRTHLRIWNVSHLKEW